MTTNDTAAIISGAICALKAESIYRRQRPEGDLLVHPAAALISLYNARICIEEIIRTGGRLPREARGLCKLLKSKKYRPLPYWLKKEYFEGLCPPGQFDPLSDLFWMAPEWENPARDEEIESFAEDSAAIVFAVENSAKAADPAKIPASTPGPDNPRPYCLKTNKNREGLTQIYDKLVAGGFIEGSAPGALANFLNAFNKDAAEQGRIKWIKKAKNGKISKAEACDFLLYFGVPANELPEYARAIFAIDLFGRAFYDNRFRNPRKENEKLCDILDGNTEEK